jgi:hypothetical protein
MPQSHAAILGHIIFSTKNREPFIDPEIEQELYPSLATGCHSAQSSAILIKCDVSRSVSRILATV